MIVVGIDGSPGAKAALQFAADEASLRQTELRVVSAWHAPTGVYMPPTYMDLDLDAFRQTVPTLQSGRLSRCWGLSAQLPSML